MANFHTKLIGLIIAQCLLLWLATVCPAQQNPAGPPPGAGPPINKNPNLDDRFRQIEESRLRSAETASTLETANDKRIEAALADIKENFRRIQIVRNDIARNLVAHKPLDYKLLSEQTGEINKRASRLKLYLQARESDDENETQHEDQMVNSLVRLCKLIDSFTENPALKNAAAIDLKQMDRAAENKARADRDLVAIVELSHRLQKQSEDLRRQ